MALSKEVIASVIADARETIIELRGAKGIFAIIKAIPAVIRKVEEISLKLGIKGANKKELALDILLALIPLPWYLPAVLIRPIIGGLIDLAVAAVNNRLKSSA